MTTACQCRSVEHIWWHVRLLYALVCLLVVLYGCSVTWLLTTGFLDSNCDVTGRGRGHDPSTDMVDRADLGVNRRLRRSSGSGSRRRSLPAFYRDSSNVDRGNSVDSDEWVWMSTYSKIPVSIGSCSKCLNNYNYYSSLIRFRFDGRSTAYQRSLRSQ